MTVESIFKFCLFVYFHLESSMLRKGQENVFCLFICLFRLVKNGVLPSESLLFSLLLLGANRMPGSIAVLSLRGRREAKGRERSEEGSCCHCCKL